MAHSGEPLRRGTRRRRPPVERGGGQGFDARQSRVIDGALECHLDFLRFFRFCCNKKLIFSLRNGPRLYFITFFSFLVDCRGGLSPSASSTLPVSLRPLEAAAHLREREPPPRPATGTDRTKKESSEKRLTCISSSGRELGSASCSSPTACPSPSSRRGPLVWRT